MIYSCHDATCADEKYAEREQCTQFTTRYEMLFDNKILLTAMLKDPVHAFQILNANRNLWY